MTLFKLNTRLHKSVLIIFSIIMLSSITVAEKKTNKNDITVLTAQEKLDKQLTSETLTTLITYVELQSQLRKEIKTLTRTLKSAQSDSEKADTKTLLKKAEKKLQDTSKNFEDIAANTDLGLLRNVKELPFNLQRELFSLLEPALKEMKHATSDVRLKSQIREKTLYYEQRVPILKEALKNISVLNRANKNKKIKNELIKMNKAWSKQLVFIQSELQAKKLQLEKLELQEKSFKKNTESFFKDFFQRRGWTLTQAFFAVVAVFILLRLIRYILSRTLKGYRAEHRGIQFRIIDIALRFTTLLLIIIAPMIIFYLEEDRSNY